MTYSATQIFQAIIPISLLKKTIPLITFAAVILVGGASYWTYVSIEANIRSEVANSLDTVLDTTHQAVRSWQKEHRATANIWANTLTVRKAAKELLAIQRDQHTLATSAAQAKLRNWLELVHAEKGYQGYTIIAPDNINVASNRDQDLGIKTLLANQETFLQTIWAGKTAVSLPEKSNEPLPDKDGKLTINLSSMFVGAPIIDESGKVLAIFAFRINPAMDFTGILKQGRIGTTGETYAFDKQGRLISNSRFDEHLRDIGLFSRYEEGILNIKLRDPGVNLVQGQGSEKRKEQQPFTRMAASATAGESGSDLLGYRNYRGVTVVGAWLWDAELGFGITTELDVTEAYKTLRATRYTIITLTLLLILLLAGSVTILIGYRKRQEAEAAHQKSEQLHRHLFENTGVGIAYIGQSGKFLEANKSFCQFTGYELAELRQMTPLDITHPDDIAASKILLAKKATAKINSFSVEKRYLRKDGTVRWGHLNSSMVRDQNGTAIDSTVAITDITARKLAEQDLKQYAQRLAEAQRIGEFGDWRWDVATDTITWSDNMYRIYGFEPGDALPGYQEHLTAYKPEDAQKLDKAVHKAVKDGTPYELVLHPRQPNGHEITVLARGEVVRNKNGKIDHLYGTVQDITDKWWAEEALRKTHEELETRVRERTAELNEGNRAWQALLQATVDSILILNKEGVCLEANEAAARRLGMDRVSLQGKNVFELMPSDVAEKRRSLLKKAMESEEELHYEDSRAGMYFETKYYPILNTEGKIEKVVVIGSEVTERKQAEAALRESEMTLSAIFEQAAVGVAMIESRGGRFLRVNQKYCDIVGYSNEEMQSLNFVEITHPDDLQQKLDNIQLLREGRIHEFSMEKRYIRKDGSLIWVNQTMSPMSKTGEQPEYYIAVVQDITERKQAMEQARQHQAELAHMARLNTMGEMATGIAHELNQPLTAINTYAATCQMMIKSGVKQPEKLNQALEAISIQAIRAGEIIRHLRQFVKKQAPQKTVIGLNKLVEEVLSFTEAEFKKQNVQLQQELADRLPEIYADTIQIEQVLVNLLRNSLEAMELAGTESRQLTIRTYLSDDGVVQVEVIDTGPGIDTETLSHIFEPFVTTKGAKGMGMGLSISRSIIEAHGGRLWAESHFEEGTKFCFTLPVGTR